MNEKDVKTGENRELPLEIEVIEEGDPKWFEIVDYEGQKAKFYPYTGAYMSVKTGQVIGNQGGRVDFDGSAMVNIAHANKREAIIDALTEIAVERGWGRSPGIVLSRIVKKAAEIALDDEGRTGTDNRKVVLGLVDYLEKESGTKGATIAVEVQTEESKVRIRAILDL